MPSYQNVSSEFSRGKSLKGHPNRTEQGSGCQPEEARPARHYRNTPYLTCGTPVSVDSIVGCLHSRAAWLRPAGKQFLKAPLHAGEAIWQSPRQHVSTNAFLTSEPAAAYHGAAHCFAGFDQPRQG